MSLLTRSLSAALALDSFIGLNVAVVAQTSGGKRAHVSLTDLCVSEGAIAALPAHRLLVTVPNVHATMNQETLSAIHYEQIPREGPAGRFLVAGIGRGLQKRQGRVLKA
jgi:hypothetical protein